MQGARRALRNRPAAIAWLEDLVSRRQPRDRGRHGCAGENAGGAANTRDIGVARPMRRASVAAAASAKKPEPLFNGSHSQLAREQRANSARARPELQVGEQSLLDNLFWLDLSLSPRGLVIAPARSDRSALPHGSDCLRSGGHRGPRHKPQVRALNQRHARQSQGVCSLAPDSSRRQVIRTHRRSLVSVCARRLSCACICSKRSSEVVGVLRHLLRRLLPAAPPPRCASVRSTRSCSRT